MTKKITPQILNKVLSDLNLGQEALTEGPVWDKLSGITKGATTAIGNVGRGTKNALKSGVRKVGNAAQATGAAPANAAGATRSAVGNFLQTNNAIIQGGLVYVDKNGKNAIGLKNVADTPDNRAYYDKMYAQKGYTPADDQQRLAAKQQGITVVAAKGAQGNLKKVTIDSLKNVAKVAQTGVVKATGMPSVTSNQAGGMWKAVNDATVQGIQAAQAEAGGRENMPLNDNPDEPANQNAEALDAITAHTNARKGNAPEMTPDGKVRRLSQDEQDNLTLDDWMNYRDATDAEDWGAGETPPETPETPAAVKVDRGDWPETYPEGGTGGGETPLESDGKVVGYRDNKTGLQYDASRKWGALTDVDPDDTRYLTQVGWINLATGEETDLNNKPVTKGTFTKKAAAAVKPAAAAVKPVATSSKRPGKMLLGKDGKPIGFQYTDNGEKVGLDGKPLTTALPATDAATKEAATATLNNHKTYYGPLSFLEG